tara:strand:- start:279 stop:665 length:387 start_codon:yes stop_codon:yes gene_type:complete
MNDKKDKEELNIYYDCKEEVRELERLLFESRLRYRKKAKKMEKQSISDYLREWYEWLIDKKSYVVDQLVEVRQERNGIKIKEEDVKMFGLESVYNLLTLEENNEFEEGYNNYINSDNYGYEDCDSYEI